MTMDARYRMISSWTNDSGVTVFLMLPKNPEVFAP